MGVLSARKALDEARKCGFRLKTDGVSLKLTTKGKPSQYLLDALKLHKAEIIKMLAPSPWKSPRR